MVLRAYPDSDILSFINRIDNILYLISVLVIQPLLVVLLLFVIVPAVYLFKDRQTDRTKQLSIVVFKIVHYIYRFIPVDRTGDVPRFVLYGFLAPVSYNYILLYTTIMVGSNCLYWFWSTAFITTEASCDNNTAGCIEASCNTSCVDIEFNGIRGFRLAVSLFAAIVFVYAFAFELLLKFSRGKALCQHCGGRKWCFKMIIVMGAQFLLIFVAKPYYISNFIAAHFTNDATVEAINERHTSYSTSLILDVLCFVMLTPWWIFEKKTSTEQDDLTIGYILERFQETKTIIKDVKR